MFSLSTEHPIRPEMISRARAMREQRAEFAEIWQVLGSKERLRAELTVDSLVAEKSLLQELGGESLRRRAIVEWMKAQHQIDAGWFVRGRKGKKSRLLWWVKPKEFVDAVCSDGLAATGASGSSGTAAADEKEGVWHDIRLRPDFVVRILLPCNWTASEAAQLSTIVSALHFENKDRR